MTDETDDEPEWNRRSLLERGAVPSIRGTVLDRTEDDPGTLNKVA